MVGKKNAVLRPRQCIDFIYCAGAEKVQMFLLGFESGWYLSALLAKESSDLWLHLLRLVKNRKTACRLIRQKNVSLLSFPREFVYNEGLLRILFAIYAKTDPNPENRRPATWCVDGHDI